MLFTAPLLVGRRLLWDNGTPNGRAAIYAQRGGMGDLPEVTVVDDFVIESGPWMLDGIVWRVAEEDRFDWAGTVDVLVFGNESGRPGHEPLVARMDLVPLHKLNTGGSFRGLRVWEYEVGGLGIALPPGTYWLGLRPVAGDQIGGSAWLTSHTVPYEELRGSECYWRCCDPDAEFVPFSEVGGFQHDVNFQVRGTAIVNLPEVRVP